MIVMRPKEVQIVSEVIGALAVFAINNAKAELCCAVKQVFAWLGRVMLMVIMMIGIPQDSQWTFFKLVGVN